MKRLVLAALGTVLASVTAQASTIAVIDSGVDFLHKDLSSHVWKNPGEIARNSMDDDNNGYVDDVSGWNFAENNNLVIDYSYLNTFSGDVYKFFEIQTKMLKDAATEDELAWMKEKRNDQEFVAELQKFGNFVHGTHVAGISAKEAVKSQIMALKLIPTEVKLPFGNFQKLFSDEGGVGPIADIVIRGGISALIAEQGKLMATIGEYVKAGKADVANCSFGTGSEQAKQIVNALLMLALNREPTEEEAQPYLDFFMERTLTSAKKLIDASPNTMFVMAAGNDGTDNDVVPTSPANVKKTNTLTVAATNGLDKLASFSNYGAEMVDVAAPGVGIESSIPGNEMIMLSGTSQAAPYVTRAVASVLDTNPRLRTVDMRDIIMGTVDKKDWLEGKVKTGGIVNVKRAVAAAELSKVLPLYEAIEKSHGMIPDMVAKRRGRVVDESNLFVMPLPSSYSK